MDKSSNITPILTGIVVVLLIYLFFHKPQPIIQEVVKVKRDTILVPAEPIVIENAVTRIRYVRDTIIVTKPFIAELDTIIKFDTVYMAYHYPENLMNLWIRKKPDSLFRDTIIITNTIPAERSIWTDILTHTTVGIISFLLGGIK